MRPEITGDARALREERFVRFAAAIDARCDYENRGDSVTWNDLRRLIDGLRGGDDLPEPEATAKAEEEPDYTCPVPGCGNNPLLSGKECLHDRVAILAAANRRIKELERERDGAWHAAEEAERKRDLPMEWDMIYFPAYAKGAEDFRESVADAIAVLGASFDNKVLRLIRSHPIPKPKEETR